MTPAPPSAPRPGSRPDDTSLLPQRLARSRPLFDPQIVSSALRESFVKLNPMTLARNPVMFVVEVGAALTTVILVRDLVTGTGEIIGFGVQIALWLWFTVLVRKLRRGDGGGARQSASRHASQDEDRGHRKEDRQ